MEQDDEVYGEETFDINEVLAATPGLSDLLVTLMQAKFNDENDALVVAEAVGSFMAAMQQGKPLRPEYLH